MSLSRAHLIIYCDNQMKSCRSKQGFEIEPSVLDEARRRIHAALVEYGWGIIDDDTHLPLLSLHEKHNRPKHSDSGKGSRMITETEINVICDGTRCYEETSVTIDNFKYATNEYVNEKLEEWGWSALKGGEHLCKHCTEELDALV